MSLFTLATAAAQGSTSALLSTYIPFIVLMLFYVILFLPGVGQRFQSYFITKDIEQRLLVLEKYANEAKGTTERLLKEKGAKDPKGLTERLAEIFVIDPVSVEPTDIISRMRLLMRSGQNKVKDMIKLSVPKADPVTVSKIEVSAEITNALNMVYKVVRHYLLQAKKLNNFYLLFQLQMVVPMLVKIAESYDKAHKTFVEGKPVGDSLGPMVASRFLLNSEKKWQVSDETIAGETYYEGRRLIVVKAEGPMATVGTPGEAVEKVVEENKGRVKRIITVDAALKLEGEKTGSIAEGTGVAMGDPGPEKIAIERVAVRYGIPIDALIVKMGMDEAIIEMRKEIYDAVDPVVEMTKQIIKERTEEGDTVVIVGVGNTSGVAQ
jgi:hypothetical protein